PGGWRPMAGAGGETPGCSSTRPFPSATSTSWGSPGSPRDLNSSNRPVRTRMPGGVAGVPRDYLGPLCRFWPRQSQTETGDAQPSDKTGRVFFDRHAKLESNPMVMRCLDWRLRARCRERTRSADMMPTDRRSRNGAPAVDDERECRKNAASASGLGFTRARATEADPYG